jgi:protein-L-isoaspartate(D-aspartate) O-methyltransferase
MFNRSFRGQTNDDDYARQRERMVRDQLQARGVSDPRVLDAMRKVPRERFLPPDQRDRAYEDGAMGIGDGQTISQPYMVAIMSQHLDPHPRHRVLEIGTGSGYQTAILAELVEAGRDGGGVIHTIERIQSLADAARAVLDELGYDGIHYHVGDGSQGRPQEGPFDRIIMTAYAPEPPPNLIDQLAEGGRFVGPVGGGSVQTLVRWTRAEGGKILKEQLLQCRFVPLVSGSQ